MVRLDARPWPSQAPRGGAAQPTGGLGCCLFCPPLRSPPLPLTPIWKDLHSSDSPLKPTGGHISPIPHPLLQVVFKRSSMAQQKELSLPFRLPWEALSDGGRRGVRKSVFMGSHPTGYCAGAAGVGRGGWAQIPALELPCAQRGLCLALSVLHEHLWGGVWWRPSTTIMIIVICPLLGQRGSQGLLEVA